MKNKYVTPESEVLYFETEDVIMTSNGLDSQEGDAAVNEAHILFDPRMM